MLTKELIERGANVTALIRDLLPTSNFFIMGLDKKVNIVHACLTDYLSIERIINEHEVDTIIHTAAQAIVSIANRSPLSTFESNIKGTWNLLEAARISKLIERVVIASSDKAYGTQSKLPYTENAPLKGEHPYDVSKSCADLIAQSYFKTYALPIGITRCGNIYGPGDLNWNRVIPGTIRALFYNQRPVIRSDGKYIRDYLYLKDAVSGYLTLAENLHRPEIKGQAFNLSTLNKLSVLDVVKLITRLMDSSLEPVVLNEVKNEIKEQYLSSEKALNLLNWKATYSIEEGLKETISWYKWFLTKYG